MKRPTDGGHLARSDKSLVGKRGFRKYLKQTKSKFEIDEKKNSQDGRATTAGSPKGSKEAEPQTVGACPHRVAEFAKIQMRRGALSKAPPGPSEFLQIQLRFVLNFCKFSYALFRCRKT